MLRPPSSPSRQNPIWVAPSVASPSLSLTLWTSAHGSSHGSSRYCFRIVQRGGRQCSGARSSGSPAGDVITLKGPQYTRSAESSMHAHLRPSPPWQILPCLSSACSISCSRAATPRSSSTQTGASSLTQAAQSSAALSTSSAPAASRERSSNCPLLALVTPYRHHHRHHHHSRHTCCCACSHRRPFCESWPAPRPTISHYALRRLAGCQPLAGCLGPSALQRGARRRRCGRTARRVQPRVRPLMLRGEPFLRGSLSAVG